MAYNYWFAFVGNVLGVAGQTTAANGWSYQGDYSGAAYSCWVGIRSLAAKTRT